MPSHQRFLAPLIAAAVLGTTAAEAPATTRPAYTFRGTPVLLRAPGTEIYSLVFRITPRPPSGLGKNGGITATLHGERASHVARPDDTSRCYEALFGSGQLRLHFGKRYRATVRIAGLGTLRHTVTLQRSTAGYSPASGQAREDPKARALRCNF